MPIPLTQEREDRHYALTGVSVLRICNYNLPGILRRPDDAGMLLLLPYPSRNLFTPLSRSLSFTPQGETNGFPISSSLSILLIKRFAEPLPLVVPDARCHPFQYI